MIRKKYKDQKGFTIIELLIATAVLSTMLVLVTAMIISIGNLYYKGINQARVQDDVRTVTSDLSQQLELNNGTPYTPYTAPVGAICLGNVRYTYVIGKKIDSTNTATSSKHVLWRDKVQSSNNCIPVDLTSNTPNDSSGVQVGSGGTELIAPNSRLIKFSLSPASPFNFEIIVGFGDDDLLCSPSAPGGQCSLDGPMSPATYYQNGDLRCKGSAGDQYCATARLKTVIVQRL